MTPSLVIGCLWVIAAAIVAMLPMKRQYVPGVTLLCAAPLLIIWLGIDYGVWVGLIGLFAFVSMFRNPLRYFWQRARGHQPKVPE